MNPNHIRTASIGTIAGITAGCITVASIVAWDTYDPWATLQNAIARRRLTPAEREELDRLRAEKSLRSADLTRARDARVAATRALFRPDLLNLRHQGSTLDTLSVPALIAETKFAINACKNPTPWIRQTWVGHRDALLDEFDRRTGWDVKYRLPELDQLRLEAAERHISTARFGLPTAPPVPAPIGPPALSAEYPDVTGPDDQPIQK